MKKTSLYLSTMIIMLGLLSSCKKLTNVNKSNPVPPTPTITVPGVYDGSLVSVRTFFSFDVTKFSPIKLPVAVPPIDLQLETATALFYNGGTSVVDAGAVSVNSFSLTKASNNAYFRNSFDAGNYTSGLDMNFSSGSSWNVGGASAVTAFTYNHTDAFPSYSGLSSLPETINKSSNLSLNITSSNADSVFVAIISGSTTASGSVIKRYGPTATNITISSADLAPLTTTGSNGIAYLEIIPWRYKMVTLNSKNYVFMKLAAYVKNVKIQ